MKKIILSAALVCLAAGAAMAEISWNANKNVGCVAGSYGSDGITIVREEVLQFVDQRVADSGADISACDGIVPTGVDSDRISEIAPWLAAQGYTNVAFEGRQNCRTSGPRDPDGGCFVDDGIANSLTGLMGTTSTRASNADRQWN